MNDTQPDKEQWQEEHGAELAKAQASAQHPDNTRPWFEGWQPDEHINEEDQSYWLLTMVDLMTLLLVLFVLLAAYAYQQKPAQPTFIDTPFDKEFSELIDPAKTPQPAAGERDTRLFPDDPLIEPATTTEPEPETTEPDAPSPPDQDIRDQFADLGDDVAVSTVAGRINLRVGEHILFASAQAVLTDEGIAVIEQLAERLERESYPVIVEGHTDDRPIQTAQFPSNWELSAARASAVVRVLIEAGIEPQRLSAVGYADTMPVTDNFTAAGRAENRRVDLVLDIPAE